MGREEAEAGVFLQKCVLILIKVKQMVCLPWMGKVAKPDGVTLRLVEQNPYPRNFKAIYITPSQPSPSREGVQDLIHLGKC